MTPTLTSSLVKTRFDYIHFLLHTGTWKSTCGNLIKNLTNADLDFFLECFIHKERIAKSHGSQCGFCTPGIVMSMYTLLRNNPVPTNVEMESAFEGMVCIQQMDLRLCGKFFLLYPVVNVTSHIYAIIKFLDIESAGIFEVWTLIKFSLF